MCTQTGDASVFILCSESPEAVKKWAESFDQLISHKGWYQCFPLALCFITVQHSLSFYKKAQFFFTQNIFSSLVFCDEGLTMCKVKKSIKFDCQIAVKNGSEF